MESYQPDSWLGKDIRGPFSRKFLGHVSSYNSWTAATRSASAEEFIFRDLG